MRPPPFEQDDRIDHIPKTNNLKPKIWVVLKSQQNVCPKTSLVCPTEKVKGSAKISGILLDLSY